MTVTAAAVMRPSHRGARVTAAQAAALTRLSHEIRDSGAMYVLRIGVLLGLMFCRFGF